ncbi:MAG: VCBS repeat-containing protein, partial [Planctomycetia bacterium]
SITPPTPVGKAPGGVATADLDGDGRTDLVVVNSDSVSILYQEADPTGPAGPFRQQVESVGIGAWGVLVADVTGDTNLDIVTANNGSNAVSILAGGAKRSFAPVRNFAAGSYPVSVAAIPGAGGHIDLLTADANDGTISILRGLGEGDFLERARTSTGINPVAVEGVDVNGDGRIDLITANSQSHDLSVLLGRGDGTFAAGTRIPLGIDPVDFYAADMNGDGRPDLVVLGTIPQITELGPVLPPIIRILLGLGDGSFSDALPPLVDADLTHPDEGPCAIAVGDINDDGLPDVVYAAQKAPPQNTSPQTAEPAVVFHTLLNRGKTFEETVTDGFVGALPRQIRVADIDRDGHLDLAATNGGSLISSGDGSQPSQTDPGNVFVFYGDGQGRFPVSSRVTAGLHPGALAVADMDGDAWPDIVVANLNEPNLNEAGDVSVLLQSPGLRTFTELLPRTTVGIFPVAIVAGEFSGDTLTDVIVANASGKSVSGLTGVGGGRFAPVHTSGLGTAVPSDLAVTDVDGDHLPDLVTVCAITNNVGLLLTDSIPTLVNGASQDVELIRDAKGVASGLLSADRQGLLRLQSLQGASVDSLSLADVKSFASTVVPMPGGRIRIASIDASRRSITIADAEPGNSRPPDHMYA